MNHNFDFQSEINGSNDWPLFLGDDVRTFPSKWDLSALGITGEPTRLASGIHLDMPAIVDELNQPR